ncbi:MAG: hypothetical protein P4L92_06190 [Rudaea sp.]|nr:hypothetical protein [Rudaea sp.]
MLPVVALSAAASAIAQAPAPVASSVVPAATAPAAHAADGGQTQGRHGKKMSGSTKVENPDTALLEYLGEYGDAADGLDPMGLADPDAPPPKSGDGKG